MKYFIFRLVGETIKIVIEDYVQHLSGYNFRLKFDPELLFNQRFQYQNRIASEFNTLYHWHPLMPDSFHIEDREYNYPQFVFNTSVVTEHGINHMVESFTRQIAGRVRITRGAMAEFGLQNGSNSASTDSLFILFLRLPVAETSQALSCMWP